METAPKVKETGSDVAVSRDYNMAVGSDEPALVGKKHGAIIAVGTEPLIEHNLK